MSELGPVLLGEDKDIYPGLKYLKFRASSLWPYSYIPGFLLFLTLPNSEDWLLIASQDLIILQCSTCMIF